MPETEATATGISPLIEIVGQGVDVAGVALIVIGLIYATVLFLLGQLRQPNDAYEQYRKRLGRCLLLGLEVLVAADIIRTVAITPTFESLGVLALLVIIRTFLSWTIEVEVDGRFPWQGRGKEGRARAEAEEAR